MGVHTVWGLPATGRPSASRVSKMRRAASRQRPSSCAFSSACALSGYRVRGNGAVGQSKAGASSLWTALECVHVSAPIVRPWKPPAKDRMLSSLAQPGPALTMQEESSSCASHDAWGRQCTEGKVHGVGVHHVRGLSCAPR